MVKTTIYVFGDSMVRVLNPNMLPHTSFIYSWGGCKMGAYARGEIRDCLQDRDLQKRTVVLVHFGTNNIGALNVSTRQTPEQFVKEMALLLDELHLYENVSVIVSSILPRPTYKLRAEIESANTLLDELCSRYGPNVKFARSYRSFRVKDNESYIVKKELFADTIHLNEKGAGELAAFFTTTIHHARFL